jgi:hypothetical protein
MDAENRPENVQKTPVTLSSEQAEVLLRRNLANLAKKVKDGKTLSAGELNLLQSSLDSDTLSTAEFAANAVELSKILNVSRKTVQRWRKIGGNPGVQPDGRYHVASWRAFKASRASSEEDNPSASQARAQQILLQNEKLKIQIAVLKREYMPCAEVERFGGELGSAIRKVIAQIHLCAPSVVGLSVADAEARLKELEDEILQQLHLLDDSIARWKHASAD